jgi:hypothetical protein
MIPNFIMQAVQRLQRDFTWGDTINGRKYHDVRWELISTPKDLGGPRLRRLDIMNKVLNKGPRPRKRPRQNGFCR